MHPKIALNRLLDEMYVLTGVDVDKQRSKVKIFGGNAIGHFGGAKMEKHGLFVIIKYTSPHTCRPIEPEKSDSEFKADE